VNKEQWQKVLDEVIDKGQRGTIAGGTLVREQN